MPVLINLLFSTATSSDAHDPFMLYDTMTEPSMLFRNQFNLTPFNQHAAHHCRGKPFQESIASHQPLKLLSTSSAAAVPHSEQIKNKLLIVMSTSRQHLETAITCPHLGTCLLVCIFESPHFWFLIFHFIYILSCIILSLSNLSILSEALNKFIWID